MLLGMPPRDMDAILGAGSGIPVTPPDVVVGVPADLVRRRPDVRRAERQVAAQSARIGVAVSDLYPHFSVLGTIGVEAEQFGDLFKSGSMIGEISPGFRWDILNYGRLVNNVRVQDARFQELAYAYQDQVLNAGREVEDAIVVFLRSQEQAPALGRERRRGRKNCRNHQRTIQPRAGRLHSRLSIPRPLLPSSRTSWRSPKATSRWV